MSRFRNESREGAKPTRERIHISENKKIHYKDIKINLQFPFFTSLDFNREGKTEGYSHDTMPVTVISNQK